MMDPMANLGGAAPGAPTSADGGEGNSGKDVFDPIALNLNLQRVDKIKTFMGIVAGCVAGILGLTGLEGLVCFIILHLTILLSIAAFKMNFNLAAFTKQSWMGFMTTNLQQSALSFMLFWTLFYGLVYLY